MPGSQIAHKGDAGMKIGALVLVSMVLFMGVAVFAAEPGDDLKINDGVSVTSADEAVRYVPPTVIDDTSGADRVQPEASRPEPATATDNQTDRGKGE